MLQTQKTQKDRVTHVQNGRAIGSEVVKTNMGQESCKRTDTEKFYFERED